MEETRCCPKCKIVKPIGEFYLRTPKRYTSGCKECSSQYRKEYYKRCPLTKIQKEHRSRNTKAQHQQLKRTVLERYGNGKLACVRCGFDDMRALSIDHIDGNGSQHTKSLRKNLYCWLKQNNFPGGYQTLCFNCQWIKRVENNELSRNKYHKLV